MAKAIMMEEFHLTVSPHAGSGNPRMTRSATLDTHPRFKADLSRAVRAVVRKPSVAANVESPSLD